jgi:ATP-binding cassette subfamily D (ALD) long-chain fatty acid import protein
MYAYKDLLELAGLTTRMYTLLSTLHSLPPVRDFKESDRVSMMGVAIRAPVVKVVDDEYEDDEKDEPGVRLVRPLRLNVEKGEHLMITGPVRTE